MKNQYSKLVHSVAFEFNNTLYFKGKMTEHPYLDLGFETRMTYGTEWILKYNLTFKSGFGFSLEAVKGTCKYEFKSRVDGDKHLTGWGISARGYLFDDILTLDRLGLNIKASYRYDINSWLTILPEIGMQMLYYERTGASILTIPYYENPDGTLSEGELIQYLEYDNSLNKRNFIPDLSASFNFLFHRKSDPRHNFTIGLNTNICFIPRYNGAYTATPPFNEADCSFTLKSTYMGLRFGYSYSSFPKPIKKAKEYRQKEPYTMFDLCENAHSLGLLLYGGFPVKYDLKTIKGWIQPSLFNYPTPELLLKYTYSIKDGWGITAEIIPLGIFIRDVGQSLDLFNDISRDTVWSNGVVGLGNGNSLGIRNYYFGFSLKASNLVNVHRNVMLQSEVGLKWLPFFRSAKHWLVDDSSGEFVISDGTETEKLVYMNCKPSISAASYAVPDLALSFNVLVHGKNPAHNFVFGISANISFLDRIHFKYQTTDVLPAHLQSSGEFGLRMTSIGLHIGYQWIKGKKKAGK